MGKFIENLLKWISEQTGISESLGATLSAVLIALLVWVLQDSIKALLARYRNSKAARDLKPQFDYQSVRQATRYYIRTQYQNASPARRIPPLDPIYTDRIEVANFSLKNR